MQKTISLSISVILLLLVQLDASFAQNKAAQTYETYSEIIENIQYSKPDSVIYISKLIIDLAEIKKDSISIAQAWNSIGRSYYIKGNYSESKIFYERASKYFIRHQQSKLTAVALNGIGLAYAAIEDHEIALPYFRKCIEIYSQLGDSTSLAKPYFNIGISFKDKAFYQNLPTLYDSALYYFNYSKSLAKRFEDRIMELRILALEGELYFFMGNYTASLFEYEKSLNLITEKDEWDKGFVLGGIAASYSKLGKYDEAINFATQAIKIQQKLGAKWEESRVQQYLYKAYEAKKMYSQAMESMKRYSELITEVFGERRSKDVAALDQAILELEKSKLRIENDAKENELFIKNLIILFLGVLLSVSLISFWRLRQKNKIISEFKQIAETKNQELQQLNALKDDVMSVMGHDMINLMGSMDGFLDLARSKQLSKEEFDAVAPMLYENVVRIQITFNNLYRWALLSDGEKIKSKERTNCFEIIKELEFLFEPLFKIQEFSFINTINPESKVSINPDYLRLIVRNLVHNAGKFTPKGGSITIYSEKKGDKIIIGVRDTGIGITNAQKEGILKTNKRLTTNGIRGEGGTGLGLVTIKNILRAYGSELQIRTTYDKGADFYFELDGGK